MPQASPKPQVQAKGTGRPEPKAGHHKTRLQPRQPHYQLLLLNGLIYRRRGLSRQRSCRNRSRLLG
ncbi:hypothetical protein ABIE67_009781 [Streptomyces sp. V4I8]